MEKYDQYNELLQRYSRIGKGFLVILIIFTIGCLIFCAKSKMKREAILTAVCCVIMILLNYIFCIYPYQKDIDDNAYTVYTGEFYVVQSYIDKGGRYIRIKYPDQKKNVRYHLLCDDSFIEDETEYEGTLVYSTRSKCVVDIILP